MHKRTVSTCIVCASMSNFYFYFFLKRKRRKTLMIRRVVNYGSFPMFFTALHHKNAVTHPSVNDKYNHCLVVPSPFF